MLDNPEAQQRAENLFYYVITAICMNDYYKELLNTKHVESIFLYDNQLSDYGGKTPDTIAISASICHDGETIGAIGLTPEAMEKTEDEILFLILHELCHILYNSDVKNYDAYMKHNELYEAELNQLIEAFNAIIGREIKNYHSGYGIF